MPTLCLFRCLGAEYGGYVLKPPVRAPKRSAAAAGLSGEEHVCFACQQQQPGSAFSKAQLRKKQYTRCGACVQAA